MEVWRAIYIGNDTVWLLRQVDRSSRIHLETNENAAAIFLEGDDSRSYNGRQRGYNSLQPWKLSSLKKHNSCSAAHVGRGARVETCLPSSSQPSLLLPATRGRLQELGTCRAEPQRRAGGEPEPQGLQTTFPRNAVVSRLRPESQNPSQAGSWVVDWVFLGCRAVRSEDSRSQFREGLLLHRRPFWMSFKSEPLPAGGELGPLATTSYLSKLWAVPRGKQGGRVDLRPWEAGGSWASTKSGCYRVSQLRVKRLISEKLPSLRSCLSEWLKLESEKGCPIYTAC